MADNKRKRFTELGKLVVKEWVRCPLHRQLAVNLNTLREESHYLPRMAPTGCSIGGWTCKILIAVKCNCCFITCICWASIT